MPETIVHITPRSPLPSIEDRGRRRDGRLPTRGGKGRLPCLLLIALLVGSSRNARAEDPPKAEPLITLGCCLPLTGIQQHAGRLYQKAYDLAVDWINRHGGVMVAGTSHRLQIKYRDDGSNPGATAHLVEQLITEDRADFLLGPFGGQAVQAAASVAESHRVPLIQAGSEVSSLFHQGFRYLFGMLPAPGTYLQPILELMTRLSPRPRTVGLAYADDAFDQEVALGFHATAGAMGFELVAEERFLSGAQDLATLIERLKKASPEAIIVAGHDEECRTFIRQARELGLETRLLACTAGVTDSSFRESLGTDTDYLFGVTAWDPVLKVRGKVFENSGEFVRLYEQTYQKEEPDLHVAAAATTVAVLKEAIETAGTQDPARVRDALAKMETDTIYGRVQFDADGQLKGGTFVVQVQLGKLYQIAPVQERPPLFPAPPWKERRAPAAKPTPPAGDIPGE